MYQRKWKRYFQSICSQHPLVTFNRDIPKTLYFVSVGLAFFLQKLSCVPFPDSRGDVLLQINEKVALLAKESIYAQVPLGTS